MSDRLKQLQDFLLERPGDGFLRHALALEYVKLGQDDQALSTWIELLKDQPDYVGSYYHLGKLHERKQNLDEAESTYKKGIEAANAVGDRHAAGELNTALMLLD
jgi:tetratricopeptide (TPR) repeat protein